MDCKLKFILIFIIGVIFFTSTNAAADNAEEPLYLGMLPYINSNRIVKLYSPLAIYLEEQIGRKVKIVTAPSFKKFIKRTDEQVYDLIFTAPHFALRAENQNNYDRLYRFGNKLKALVFTSMKSEITDTSLLKGQVLAMPDELAIVSSLGEVFMEGKGFHVNEDYVIYNTPSHNNTIMAVLNKNASAGVVAHPLFDAYVRKNPNKLKFIAETDEVPGAMFMMKSNLDPEKKKSIRKAFENFPQSKLGKKFFKSSPFDGMVSVNEEEMQSLQQYLTVLEKHLCGWQDNSLATSQC